MKPYRGSASLKWNALDTQNVFVWLGTSAVGSTIVAILGWFGIAVPDELKAAWHALLVAGPPAFTAVMTIGRAAWRLVADNPHPPI